MAKHHYKGLEFSYYFKDILQWIRYKDIEDCKKNKASTGSAAPIPRLRTEIFDVRWHGNIVGINKNIKTYQELINVLNEPSISISDNNIWLPNGVIRKAIIPIEEIEDILKEMVLQNISVKKKNKKSSLRASIRGEEIYILSDRYKLFFTKGYTCVECGLTGRFFALEKHLHDNQYHLNLYAFDENGNEVLMTKDHILPKSKGGTDILDNYQVMCTHCNTRKGNNVCTKEEI